MGSICSRDERICVAGEAEVETEGTLEMFLPKGACKHTQFFRYYGSLTTPKCNEVVIWTVMANPISLSHDQVRASFITITTVIPVLSMAIHRVCLRLLTTAGTAAQVHLLQLDWREQHRSDGGQLPSTTDLKWPHGDAQLRCLLRRGGRQRLIRSYYSLNTTHSVPTPVMKEAMWTSEMKVLEVKNLMKINFKCIVSFASFWGLSSAVHSCIVAYIIN